MTRYIHYSAGFITEAETVPQINDMHLLTFAKPRGLWFSVDGNGDGWPEWCQAEGVEVPLSHKTEVVFRPNARVLELKGAKALDAFTQEYLLRGPALCIDWVRVEEKHDAIIIAPYVWRRRLSPKTPWYYCWDCASGCVWNADAIQELRALSG